MRLRRIVWRCSQLSRPSSFRSSGLRTGRKKNAESLRLSFLRIAAAGDVVPESGGIRKVRWKRQGTGKSGGVRVIYFTKNEVEELVLLTLYAKSKTDNLSGPVLKEIRRALED